MWRTIPQTTRIVNILSRIHSHVGSPFDPSPYYVWCESVCKHLELDILEQLAKCAQNHYTLLTQSIVKADACSVPRERDQRRGKRPVDDTQINMQRLAWCDDQNKPKLTKAATLPTFFYRSESCESFSYMVASDATPTSKCCHCHRSYFTS